MGGLLVGVRTYAEVVKAIAEVALDERDLEDLHGPLEHGARVEPVEGT